MKRISVTPKQVSLAKLEGLGFGAWTKASAAGCAPRYCSTGFGDGTSGPLAATARRNSRNSSPVLVGNPSVEWLTMSVCTCSARWNRMARPRGLALGSLSGMSGTPVELENRAVTGVEARVMCGALVSDTASGSGVKVPESMVPLACAARKPGCNPKSVSNCLSKSWLRASSFSSVGNGILVTCRAKAKGHQRFMQNWRRYLKSDQALTIPLVAETLS